MKYFAKSAMLCAILSISWGPAIAGPKLEIEPGGTYVLVEILNAANAGLGGSPIRGDLVIARFDPVEGHIRRPAAASEGADSSVRVSLGRKPIAKNKNSALFLAKIAPDTWVIESSGSTSFSLGSLTFVAKPGEVIDLGFVDASPDLAEGEKPQTLNAGAIGKAILGGVLFRRPPVPRPLKLEIRPRTAADLPVPASLADRAVTVPQFVYGARFPNYLGGLVNRIDGREGRNRPTDSGQVSTPPPPAQP